MIKELLTKELYFLRRENKIKNNKDITIQKIINFSIEGNIKQKGEIENVINYPQLFSIKNSNNSEKFFEQPLDILNSKENNKIQDISGDVQDNSFGNCSMKNNHMIKVKYFFIEKRLNKNNMISSKANNEIKALKNNKIVYINKNLLNSYATTRGVKKLKKFNFIIEKKRGSKYRGVSKNGHKWQVLIMINKKKCYLGNYSSEDLAARIYDIQAIKSRGIRARTNFVYDNNQIYNIYKKKININCNNISDIITQLNN